MALGWAAHGEADWLRAYKIALTAGYGFSTADCCAVLMKICNKKIVEGTRDSPVFALKAILSSMKI